MRGDYREGSHEEHHQVGARPGVRRRGPMGQEIGDTEQWRFPVLKASPKEKKIIVAEVVKTCPVPLQIWREGVQAKEGWSNRC